MIRDQKWRHPIHPLLRYRLFRRCSRIGRRLLVEFNLVGVEVDLLDHVTLLIIETLRFAAGYIDLGL